MAIKRLLHICQTYAENGLHKLRELRMPASLNVSTVAQRSAYVSLTTQPDGELDLP